MSWCDGCDVLLGEFLQDRRLSRVIKAEHQYPCLQQRLGCHESAIWVHGEKGFMSPTLGPSSQDSNTVVASEEAGFVLRRDA